MARYTITITADRPNEPSAKVAVEYTEQRGGRVLEWSVVPGRGGHAPPPVLDAVIAAFDGDGQTQQAVPFATADLGLSSGTDAAMWKSGITRVQQLSSLTEAQLLRVPGVNRRRAEEIISALGRFDLGLASDFRGNENVETVAVSAVEVATHPATAASVPRQRGRVSGRQGQNRAYRRAPGNLADLYAQFGGSPSAIAAAQGVPAQTARNWVHTGRKTGLLPAAKTKAGTSVPQGPKSR